MSVSGSNSKDWNQESAIWVWVGFGGRPTAIREPEAESEAGAAEEVVFVRFAGLRPPVTAER